MAKNFIVRQRKLQQAIPSPPESPYQRLYGLRDNPFPSMALFTASTKDPRVNGDIYDEEFRKDEEKIFFERFVLPPTGDSPLPIGFVRLDPQAGGRGNGKSTFLHHLMVRINNVDWHDWPDDPEDPRLSALAIHLLPEPRKQNDFFKLLRLVFETLYRAGLGVDGRKRLIHEVDGQIRAALLLDLLTEDQADEIAARPEEDVTQDFESEQRFAALLEDLGIKADAIVERAQERLSIISPTCLDNDFIKAFFENGASIERVWEAWRESGWVESDNRWKRRGAEWLTDGLVPVLVMAGYQRLYVLLDEFEKIYIYQTGKKREEFLDLLRQVFYEQDSAAVRRRYITTVLSIHPSIETYLKNHWSRVGLHQLAPLSPGEIGGISVSLGKSSEKRLEHLLVTYLDYYRSDADPKKRGTIYPFARGSLEPLITRARMFPRDTLRYAHGVLRKAASESKPAPLSKSFVEKFLASEQTPLDEDDDDLSPVLIATQTNLKD